MADVPRPARARLGLSGQAIPAWAATAARAFLLAAGPALFLLGLATTPVLQHLPKNPLKQTIVLWLGPWLVATAAAWLARRRVADLLALVWLALLLVFVGPRPLLATAALAAAGLALGHGIAPARPAALRLLLGLVLIAGGLGWLLALPLHLAALYWPLLLAVIGWRWRVIVLAADALARGWRKAVDPAPASAAWAVATLGLLSTAAWLPTLQFDDIAYHLGLPSQLHQLGWYRLDVHSQMWALAPWASDVLQAVVQVLSGEEGRGALNMLWLALLAGFGFRITRALGADAAAGWATVALIASLPPLVWLVGGMQVELPAAALALAIALLLVEPGPAPASAGRAALAAGAAGTGVARMFALAVLAGGLMGTKASHVMLALPLAAWWLLQQRGALPWPRVPAAVALMLAVGGSSYVHAWALTGNPLLPMFNDWFPNAIAEGNRIDDRWLAGVGWDLPWRMAFETDRYVEAFPGGYGFLMVVLAGGGLAALVRGPARPLAWAALAAWVLPLLLLQYARYVVPALVLLVPALVLGTRALAGARLGLLLLVLAWGANLAFFANGSWIWRGSAVKSLLDHRDEGLPRVLQDYGPERALGRVLRERSELRLLVIGPEPAYAEFGGRAFSASSYDRELASAAAAAAEAGTAEAWAGFFARYGFTHVSIRPGFDPAFDVLLPATGAVRELQLGRIELWRLPVTEGARDLMRERDAAARLRAGW